MIPEDYDTQCIVIYRLPNKPEPPNPPPPTKKSKQNKVKDTLNDCLQK